jgi:hypothetical protein
MEKIPHSDNSGGFALLVIYWKRAISSSLIEKKVMGLNLTGRADIFVIFFFLTFFSSLFIKSTRHEIG